MTTPAHRDAEELRDAIAHPLPRHSIYGLHEVTCACRQCMRDNYEPGDW